MQRTNTYLCLAKVNREVFCLLADFFSQLFTLFGFEKQTGCFTLLKFTLSYNMSSLFLS